jgi:hypothetical protein
MRLCMVWNGGPGAGSELLWLSLGPDAPRPITELCNALFVDARNTGLSYELVDSPASHVPQVASYNAYTDASDYLRALHALWPKLAPKRIEEIVPVGESYGGVRAALLLDLARTQGTASDAPFASDLLSSELRAFFTTIGKTPDELFRHQILIQPTVAGSLQDSVSGELLAQPDSVLRQLADQLGATLDPCSPPSCDAISWAWNGVTALGRSAYDYRASTSWLEDQFAAATRYADTPLAEQLDTRDGDVAVLAAAQRDRAFRIADVTRAGADAESWTSRFGKLGSHDRYFIEFNSEANAAFGSEQALRLGVDGQQSSYGSAFLRAIRGVDTFVTRADFDLINYSPAFGPTLERFSEVESATLEDTNDTRSGSWHVRFRDGAEARIRAPAYPASHSVANDTPGELLDDVADWLGR